MKRLIVPIVAMLLASPVAAQTYVPGSGSSSSPATAPDIQKFTSGTSATYTTPDGAGYLRVRGCGGGGGGASATAASGQTNVGASAGGGGCFEHIIANPAASYTYTVGAGGAAGSAGGNTTFTDGASLTLTGSGGTGTSSNTTSGTTLARSSAPGFGGAASGGNVFNIPGGPGQFSLRYSGTEAIAPPGGSSAFGAGGISATSGNGQAGLGCGGGGGGAASLDATPRTGGAGAAGCIEVEAY